MKPSSELCGLIVQYFESFTIGDPDWVERHVLHGAELRLIGTGPEEWLHGTQGFAVFQREAAEATGTLTAEASAIEAYSEGGVGWGAARVRFTLPSGQSAQSRFSVVFVLRDGTWKVVSAHNSVAVDDQDAFAPT